MLTPFEIQEAIEESIDKLSELSDQLAVASYESAKSEADFKVNFAKERLKARAEGQETGNKVTVDTAEDIATVATEDDRYNHLLASNKLTTLREAIRVTQSQIEALRTLAASQRNNP